MIPVVVAFLAALWTLILWPRKRGDRETMGEFKAALRALARAGKR